MPELLTQIERIADELWNKFAEDRVYGPAQQAAITMFAKRIREYVRSQEK